MSSVGHCRDVLLSFRAYMCTIHANTPPPHHTACSASPSTGCANFPPIAHCRSASATPSITGSASSLVWSIIDDGVRPPAHLSRR